MSAETVTQIVKEETGRFYQEIYNRLAYVSPWITLMPRAMWPQELGQTISVLTYERSAPTVISSALGFVNVSPTVSGAEGGACLPPVKQVTVGSTERTFNLQHMALEGPAFCATNFQFPFQLERQLEKVFGVLTDYTRLTWDMYDRYQYFLNTKRKVSCGATITETFTGATVYPTTCPTSTLTQGILDRYKLKLLRDGAGISAMGKDGGNPTLTLICSGETSDSLIRDNADIRQDLRWGKPNELLQQIGVERSYRGWFHVIDETPRRFTCSAGTYTEVPTYVAASATNGNKAEINSDWETAPYEESHAFDPTVMRQLIPEPITKPHPKFQFDPVRFLGDWKLMNVIHRNDNPDGTIIYHRGILGASSEPVHPERGISFIHKRCDPAIAAIAACS